MLSKRAGLAPWECRGSSKVKAWPSCGQKGVEVDTARSDRHVQISDKLINTSKSLDRDAGVLLDVR